MGLKFNFKFFVILSLIVILTIVLVAASVILTRPKPGDPDPVDFLPPSSSVLRKFKNATVASEDAVCSRIGKDILQRNGSAVDSIIAVTLCIGVKGPQSSGIGGGVLILVYSGNKIYAINGREYAPKKAVESLYKTPDDYAFGGKAVAVMGEIAALWEAHQRFGRLPWSELVKPSRLLAQNGFKVTPQLAKVIGNNKDSLRKDPVLLKEFTNENGTFLEVGDFIVRSTLAKTLKKIEDEGRDGFYKGELAQTIVKEINHAAGMEFFTLEDMDYKVDWTEPISYKLNGPNYTLHSLSFPSGGPVVAMALGILDKFGSKSYEYMSMKEIAQDQHILVEALKFAAAHRARSSDPKFANLTEIVDRMLSPEYADELYSRIHLTRTYADPAHYGAVCSMPLSPHGTAHMSVLASDGEAASATSTINWAFGASFMGNSSGIIYNNENDDFSSHSRGSDCFGLLINDANRIEPGKRPASSMTPLIILNANGQVVFVNGGSGGVKIVPAVISTTWRALYRQMDVKEANDFPRMMPQFTPPNELSYEQGLPKPIIEELMQKGHVPVKLTKGYWAACSAINVNYFNNNNSKVESANADFRKIADCAGF